MWFNNKLNIFVDNVVRAAGRMVGALIVIYINSTIFGYGELTKSNVKVADATLSELVMAMMVVIFVAWGFFGGSENKKNEQDKSNA